ncbi:MAG TPA: long-chain fatty acid--CoA ligase [Thermoanaerobaculia bacterium]|nr:long-chain fatty acid--CoA ligase [Thermoanaerobaculia bacterium]
MTVSTLSELFRVVVAHDKPDCLLHKVDGRYQPISTREFAAWVRALAKTLERWGIRPGDRVALMAENGPHWPTVDFAVLALGAVHVPIYATLLPEGAAYVVRDSGARVVFVGGRQRLEGLLGVRDQMPSVERFVLIGDGPVPEGVVAYERALAEGADVDPAEFQSWLDRARPSDLATLIYTSGTTGDPKGVMLTHGNLASNASTCSGILPMKRDWVALSFLPLAHSFERTIDYVFFHCGVSIAYAESVQTVGQNMLEVRPHVFGSVPRVYEKVRSKVLESAAEASGLRKRIFDWSLATGHAALPQRLVFEDPSWKLRLADKLVFSKIRARLGGRFEYAVSGGAPLGKEVAEFFWAAGIPLLEGYGLTETSPVIAVNTPEAVRIGTVGRPIPGVEVRIAADGEILSRGPHIMKGYFNQPQATADAIDSDGWFRTGDIGALDADGFLSITDRKKEIIVNAYGKNIAPAPIEGELKAGRWTAQAVVVGDRRPFLVALLVPNFESLAPWAKARGIAGGPEEWVRDERVRALFEEELERVNSHHERYEQVRAFELLPRELTLENGELTPTMKVKRRIIHERFRPVLDRLYEGSSEEHQRGRE